MKMASIADVKDHFRAYLKASEQGPIVVTRNGRPVAILSAVSDQDEVERLMMARSPELQAILKAARERIEAGKGIPNDEFWERMASTKETNKQPGKRRKPA